jgi:hypothetical protein
MYKYDRDMLDKRIITPEDRRLKEAHNKEDIPSIIGIEDSIYYDDMKKFTIDETRDTTYNNKICIPEILLKLYFGEKYDDIVQNDIEGEFKFLHSRRGLETKMALVPTSTYKLLPKLGLMAESFLGYFEGIEDATIKRTEAGIVSTRRPDERICTLWGIPGNYSHSGRSINFYAINGFYVRMERVINGSG